MRAASFAVVAVLAACQSKAAEPPVAEPPPGNVQSKAAEPPVAEPPPGNVVQHEMRLMTAILEATVRGIGMGDVSAIDEQLHQLHAAKEATTAAVKSGAYRLPKQPESVDAFIALDDAFHKHLGALVVASRANDVPAAAAALGEIMRGCHGCHSTFRAP